MAANSLDVGAHKTFYHVGDGKTSGNYQQDRMLAATLPGMTASELVDFLKDSIEKCVKAELDSRLSGAASDGTTLTCAGMTKSGNLIVANIGDSPSFLVFRDASGKIVPGVSVPILDEKGNPRNPPRTESGGVVEITTKHDGSNRDEIARVNAQGINRFDMLPFSPPRLLHKSEPESSVANFRSIGDYDFPGVISDPAISIINLESIKKANPAIATVELITCSDFVEQPLAKNIGGRMLDFEKMVAQHSRDKILTEFANKAKNIEDNQTMLWADLNTDPQDKTPLFIIADGHGGSRAVDAVAPSLEKSIRDKKGEIPLSFMSDKKGMPTLNIAPAAAPPPHKSQEHKVEPEATTPPPVTDNKPVSSPSSPPTKSPDNKDKAGRLSKLFAVVIAGITGWLGFRTLKGGGQEEGVSQEKPSGWKGFMKVAGVALCAATLAVTVSHAVTGGRWQAKPEAKGLGKFTSGLASYAGWTRGG